MPGRLGHTNNEADGGRNGHMIRCFSLVDPIHSYNKTSDTMQQRNRQQLNQIWQNLKKEENVVYKGGCDDDKRDAITSLE
jgi:hypothetical protein